MKIKKTYCTSCNSEGAEPVTCMWCKEKTGRPTIHLLCNDCFMLGCPIASPEKHAKEKKRKDHFPIDFEVESLLDNYLYDFIKTKK